MEKMNSRKRLTAVIQKPAERAADGMSSKAPAFELHTPEANICRDLKVPDAEGWIEKINGTWRMSPKSGGFAGTVIKGFQTARLRLTEDGARYASEMQ